MLDELNVFTLPVSIFIGTEREARGSTIILTSYPVVKEIYQLFSSRGRIQSEYGISQSGSQSGIPCLPIGRRRRARISKRFEKKNNPSNSVTRHKRTISEVLISVTR